MNKLLFFFVFLLSCSAPSMNREQITAPYDGRRFSNLEPFPDKSFFTVMKWKWDSRNTVKEWPFDLEREQYKPLKERSQDLVVTVISHATVLIQVAGVNILTDPHFTERASPVSWAGPKRHVPPGIKWEDLPPIDVVLISHNHYDHLDLETLRKLSDRFQCLIYAGLGTADFLTSEGIARARDLDWWQQESFKEVAISFVPAQHWSARGLFDKREMLWGGFYVKADQASVYFAGDTGYGKFLNTIRERLGPPDVALLPIGAYEPRWFMKNAHMNPQDAVMALQDLQAKTGVGMHFGTFQLTDEPITAPVQHLKEAMTREQLKAESFIVPTFGKAILF